LFSQASGATGLTDKINFVDRGIANLQTIEQLQLALAKVLSYEQFGYSAAHYYSSDTPGSP